MILEIDEYSHEIFKDLFAFFGILSSEGSILSLSGRIFSEMSVKPEVLIGQNFTEVVFWQTSDENINILKHTLENAGSVEKQSVLVNFRVSSKEKIPVELQIKTFPEKKQIFFCARKTSNFEFDSKSNVSRSNQLYFAAENAEIGLWYWDLNNNEIHSNKKCKEIFEIEPDQQITLEKVLEIIHSEDRERFEEEIKGSKKNEAENITEFRIINSEGKTIWISLSGKTVIGKNGEPESISGIVRNINDRKMANEQLANLYSAEKKALDQAEEANRAKDFFLAFVSHELRSPLNAILGWTKILLTKKLNEEKQKNALETIERSARSQAQLINDLVDSARVASGKLRLEFHPLNIYQILKNVYESQKPNAVEKNIELEFSADREDLQIFGDATRLQQVFVNLVSNALKFTHKDGKVSIILESNSENVKVFIKDNGQGISKEALPRIFRQYSQGDENTSRDTTGLGLGLSIVKTLVKKHNGTIAADSEGLGNGAVFTVCLPLIAMENSEVEKKVKNFADELMTLKELNILIVEDDPDSCEVLQLLLEQNGADVECAESAIKALDLLVSGKVSPDIIISDLGMPEIDGYALLEKLRTLQERNINKIPAIALSAFTAAENKKKAFEVGFQTYHTKPFEPDLLLSEIIEATRNPKISS